MPGVLWKDRYRHVRWVEDAALIQLQDIVSVTTGDGNREDTEFLFEVFHRDDKAFYALIKKRLCVHRPELDLTGYEVLHVWVVEHLYYSQRTKDSYTHKVLVRVQVRNTTTREISEYDVVLADNILATGFGDMFDPKMDSKWVFIEWANTLLGVLAKSFFHIFLSSDRFAFGASQFLIERWFIEDDRWVFSQVSVSDYGLTEENPAYLDCYDWPNYGTSKKRFYGVPFAVCSPKFWANLHGETLPAHGELIRYSVVGGACNLMRDLLAELHDLEWFADYEKRVGHAVSEYNLLCIRVEEYLHGYKLVHMCFYEKEDNLPGYGQYIGGYALKSSTDVHADKLLGIFWNASCGWDDWTTAKSDRVCKFSVAMVRSVVNRAHEGNFAAVLNAMQRDFRG